jgi:hypothetical protein
VLNNKDNLHFIFASLLDGKWFVLQVFESARLSQINGDITSAFNFLRFGVSSIMMRIE